MSRCARCNKKAYACYCPPERGPDLWLDRDGVLYKLVPSGRRPGHYDKVVLDRDAGPAAVLGRDAPTHGKYLGKPTLWEDEYGDAPSAAGPAADR